MVARIGSFVVLALVAILWQSTRARGAPEEAASRKPEDGSALRQLFTGDAPFAEVCPHLQQEIKRTIRGFFTAMAERDAATVQAIVDDRFVAIEAGRNVRVDVVDPKDPKRLLPPEGNDDWENVKLADVRVQISETLPSVAVATFSLSFPVDADQLAMIQKLLQNPPPELNEVRRRELQKQIDAKCTTVSIFAVVGHRKGKWRIICMTFPK